MGNILAIVGRPNVGKSTLFNRFTESRNAIVEPTSGVTRVRHYGKVIWGKFEFSVIDTGGYVVGSDDIFEEEIRNQVQLAIDEANVVLFMVDALGGITDLDLAIAEILRKSPKKVILAANKIDTSEHQYYAAEWYALGLGEVFQVSANNGRVTGDLLDEVIKDFVPDEEVEKEDLPHFAIVGRPNVGKSSLLNALTGQERNIVTPISGTTRDSIDTRYNAFGFDFMLVDTAGIRKRAKVHEDIEFYSVLRSVRSIEGSDVCLMMVDATQGFEKQDQHIFGIIEKNRKGIVILVNKWDLVEKDTNTTKEFETMIREKLAPFSDVPIIFTSVVTKQRLHKALEIGLEVFNNRVQKIPTSKLNEFLLEVVEHTPPPSYKGKYIKIKYVTQLPVHAPAFAIFCNLPQYIREDYRRFLENRLREKYDFSGVPIRIFFRKK